MSGPAWQRGTAYWRARQDRYGPPGTTDAPMYDARGKDTGREAGAAARTAERKQIEAERNERNARRGRL